MPHYPLAPQSYRKPQPRPQGRVLGMRYLSICVALVAVFAGVFVYKVYLPLSPKIKDKKTSLVILYEVLTVISSAGEKLGISPRYKTVRFLYDIADMLFGTLNYYLGLGNVPEVETIEDTTIAGVPVRIYRPRNAGDKQRPGLIYFHAGGMVFLKARSMLYDNICSRFANETQSVVISVEYRRAPEHPFPAQFQDGYAVVLKVLENSSKYGIISSKIAIVGDSAGGLLTAAISIELAKENRAVAAQMLIYPWLQLIDLTCLPSYQDYAQGFVLPREDIVYLASLTVTGKPDMEQEYLSGNISRYFMNQKYWKFLEIPESSQKCKVPLQQTTDLLPTQFLETVVNPRLSPLLAESVEGLPPTFMAIAKYDVLSSEGDLFARRLNKAGISIVKKTYKECHGFLYSIFLPLPTPSVVLEAMQDMINFLNAVFY